MCDVTMFLGIGICLFFGVWLILACVDGIMYGYNLLLNFIFMLFGFYITYHSLVCLWEAL